MSVFMQIKMEHGDLNLFSFKDCAAGDCLSSHKLRQRAHRQKDNSTFNPLHTHTVLALAVT